MARVADLRRRVVGRCHVIPVDVGSQFSPQLLYLLGAAEAVEPLSDNHGILPVGLGQEQIELNQ